MIKNSNKIITLLLSAAMAFSMAVPAFADTDAAAAGSSETQVVESVQAGESSAETAQDASSETQESAAASEKQTAQAGQQVKEDTSSSSSKKSAGTSVRSTAGSSKTAAGASVRSATASETDADAVTPDEDHSDDAAIDNSTMLSDGTYTIASDKFSFTGGTGKVKIQLSSITVKDGKAYADITFTSSSMKVMQTGGRTYKYKLENGCSVFEDVPVDLNSKQQIWATTYAMSEPHTVGYKITVNITEPEADSDTEAVDNSTDIPDGVYVPDSFTYTGGTGKVTITCPKITVKSGKATAQIVFSSTSYTKLKADGRVFTSTIDTTAGTSTFEIPVSIGKAYRIIGLTTAMSKEHWVAYEITVNATKDSAVYKETAADDSSKNDTTDGSKKKKLKAGYTYKVKSNTDNRMFYLWPNLSVKGRGNQYSLLRISKKGKMTAEIILTGQGYDYVYMGTAKAAAKTSKSNWSKASVKKGYYTYKIPVRGLDRKLTISAHSKKLNKWFQHTIIFYSDGAKKTSRTSLVPGTKNKNTSKKSKTYKRSGKQTKFKNNHKADKVSKYKDDSSKSTSSVDNSTTLKDGVYTPSSFSWSGGSGRLAYIRCSKLTVKNGKVYATIVFGSSSYDQLKANGSIYSKSGGGNSTFVIPVKLNSNNTIIGRTTAMSQPHWVKYTIYIGKAESKAKVKKEKAKEAAEKKKQKTKISSKAPKIDGLKYKKTIRVKHAKLFKIFQYNHGVTLIQMDISKDNYLYTAYKKASAASDEVEYDEEGKPIGKSAHEYTEALYKNKVVNYLVVPKDYDVPAGLEKDYIIIRRPVKRGYVASEEALSFMDRLDVLDKINTLGFEEDEIKIKALKDAFKEKSVLFAGAYNDPDYARLVLKKSKYAVLPSDIIPDEIDEDLSGAEKKEAVSEAEKKVKALEKEEAHFTELDMPVIIDRSDDEKGKLAKAEWIKVYGAVFGEQEKSVKLYNDYIKEAAEK
jgi:hypothetical protein